MGDTLSAWLDTTIGSWAMAYAANFEIFPLHGVREDLSCTCGKIDCGKNTGKHPFTRHGLNDSSKNIVDIAARFHCRSDLNIGIRTGEGSGFFVLDIDGDKGGWDSLALLEKEYAELPLTTVVITGNGAHLYFNYPKDMKITNRTKFRPGIDVRGTGGYVVGVPSTHLSGKKYQYSENSITEMADAPIWFLSLLRASPKKEENKAISSDHSTGEFSEWSEEEVQRMLDVLDPDMSYDDWLSIGLALNSGGFKLSLWDSWSRSGEKYQNGDCERRWHGFVPDHGITMGTLVKMAQLQGWKLTRAPRAVIDTSNIDPIIKKADSLSSPAKVASLKRSFPLGFDALLETPGLIGDTVRWINKFAIRKQPELALINTLCFAGAVFGRRYASPLNTRTNLYIIGIANTGDGKDHSRKCIKELANAAGLNERIGADDIRSDSGLLRGLSNNSSQLMMIDEFGHFLQAISNDKSPHYIRSQVKILLKLYSSSNSIYNHGDYADKKTDAIIIQYPNLCIYGTSTEETYSKSMRKRAIESGELNRFIAVCARTDLQYPERIMPAYEIDQAVVEGWTEFSAKLGDGIGLLANTSDIAPEVITIPWGECDEIQYKLQCRQVDKIRENSPYRHLWGRFFENTVKIAMIFAIARDKHNPAFKKEDFDLAQMIVESSIEYLLYLATHHMSETPQEESTQEIVNAIRDAGGEMGRRDIMRKFRKLKKRDLDDVLSSLLEQEAIEAEKIADGKGRPKTVYRVMKEN